MDTTNQESQNEPEQNLKKTEDAPSVPDIKSQQPQDDKPLVEAEKVVKPDEPHQDKLTTLPSQSGIDYRAHPLFLGALEYFGIKEKEYSLAINKISEIVDWAAVETNSNDIRKILTKIAETSRILPSAGYSEKRYAILYRYIKLLSDRRALEKALAPKPVDREGLMKEKEGIDEQIKAYQTV